MSTTKQNSPIINNYTNRVTLILDRSGSMTNLSKQVIDVFDNQIKHLAKQSQILNQETRISIYLFNDKVECLIFDKDVLRLPSIKNLYNTSGQTALIDATLKAIDDLLLIPELYNDNSHLVFLISDGQSNADRNSALTLTNRINKLPDNWTIAAFAPNQLAVHDLKKCGFPKDNISIWNTDSEGLEEVGNTIKVATDNFMRARATGIRSTKNLFNVDVSTIKPSDVKNNLDQLAPSQYNIIPVRKDNNIKTCVEEYTYKDYVKGSTYYQLTKKETIQSYKQICIKEKLTGKIYSGLNARTILGIPNDEVKINPVSHGKFDIFVQSISSNRKVFKDTQLLVMK